jgi:lambda family phage tail tape measure protein
MTVSAGSLDILVSADTAQASSSLSKLAADVEREMDRTAKASLAAQRDSDRFIASLQRQVDTFGKTDTEIKRYTANLKGASAAADPLIDKLERMQADQAAMSAKMMSSAEDSARAIGLLRTAFLALGGVASIAGLQSLITGGIEAKAKLYDLSIQTGISVEALSGLGKVAKFSNTELDFIASSSNKLSKALFTQNEDSKGAAQAIKALGLDFNEFKSLKPEEQFVAVAAAMGQFEDGTAKSAAAMLLYGKQGATLLPFLKELEERGFAVGMQTTESALAAKRYEDNLVSLEIAAGQWKRTLAEAVLPTLIEITNQMIDARKGADSFNLVGEAIKTFMQTVTVLGANVAFVFQGIGREIGALFAQAAALGRGDFAGFSEISAAVKADGVKARADLDETEKRLLGIVPKISTAGDFQRSDKDRTPVARPKLALDAPPEKKARGLTDQDRLESSFDKAMNSLGAENAKLAAEAESWEKYGKAVDKGRVAVTLFDLAQGKLTGKGGAELTMSQKADLLERAALADAQAATIEQAKAGAAADKRTKSIEAAANAQAMNARETKIAAELTEIENSGLVKGTALYEQKAAARRAAVNADFDTKLRQQLAADQVATDAEVRKMDEQIKMIGKSTIERQKNAVAIKLQDEAQKKIDAGGNAALILGAMIERRNALTDAIQRQYDAERTGSAGVAAALQKYEEEATNYAKSANELVTHVLAGLEDGLTALLTGKKLDFKSFVDSVISEIIRLQVVKPLLASIFGQGTAGGGAMQGAFGGSGGGLLSGLGNLAGSFGGGFGFGGTGFGASLLASDAGALGGSVAGDLLAGVIPLAEGTNYVPYDGLKMLHKGEAVVPARYNPEAGDNVNSRRTTIHQTINFTSNQPTSKQTEVQLAAVAAAGLRRGERNL